MLNIVASLSLASFPLRWNWPGPLSSSRSPGVSFLKVGAGWAAGTMPGPPPFYSQERGGSCRKDLSEPGESEGTALQAQMRWEGPFPTVLCGCLLGGPYVPMPTAGQMKFMTRNMQPLFFLSAPAAVWWGVRKGGANALFCGLRCHLIQLLLVSLCRALPKQAPCTGSPGHSPHGA